MESRHILRSGGRDYLVTVERIATGARQVQRVYAMDSVQAAQLATHRGWRLVMVRRAA